MHVHRRLLIITAVYYSYALQFHFFNKCMFCNSKFILAAFLCFFFAQGIAQRLPLNIGDNAPSLTVKEWIKGRPISEFKKGKVYVIEFWATWCKPCIAAMPHLSTLAKKFADDVNSIALSIYENKNMNAGKLHAFVDSMGATMNFDVGWADNLLIETWLEASGEKGSGIPNTFIINQDGKLAWIGHPSAVDTVLYKVVNKSWDIPDFYVKRKLNLELKKMDKEANNLLNDYSLERGYKNKNWYRDSALFYIRQIIEKHPTLRYTPFMASHYFKALLLTDFNKASAYGKVVLETSTYEEPAFDAIIGNINWLNDKLNLPREIYLLGAQAYEMKIQNFVYPEIIKTEKYYAFMAEWYWKGGEDKRAIVAQQKAFDISKSKGYSQKEISALEEKLHYYMKVEK